MDKLEIISKLKQDKIVAIIRAESKEKAEKTIDSIIKGGISIIEITMTVPEALDIIKVTNEKYRTNEDVIIGAGTVLDPETARMAMLAGAKFIVSPSLNEDTIKICNRYRVPIIPGITTVKEAIESLELGVDILKVFPGNMYGPSIIKTLKGPLPQANFIPTGGVSLDTAKEWLENGAVAIGIGNSLTAIAKDGDYESIIQKAKEFVNIVKK